jgi:molybdopterin-guanine dinucleotide biosynthesis protein A
MGQDKLWMELDGQPLVERVVRRALPLASEVLFSTNAAGRFAALIRSLRAERVSAQVVADHFPAAGPLAGLHAGLSASRNDLLLALAADLPFVSLPLVRHTIGLAAGYDAVIPEIPHPRTGKPVREPLHALYRRSCLPAIAARLAAGERQALCFLPDVQARFVAADEVARFDPGLLSFFNINTPDDWRQAQRLATGNQ